MWERQGLLLLANSGFIFPTIHWRHTKHDRVVIQAVIQQDAIPPLRERLRNNGDSLIPLHKTLRQVRMDPCTKFRPQHLPPGHLIHH